MKIKYFPESDMLTIQLARTPYTSGGAEDTSDSDVVLHFDGDERLAEIEVSNASARVDLGEVRRMLAFEEVRPTTAEAA